MDEQPEQATQTSGSLTYYLLGAIVLALIAGGVYFLRPKSSTITPNSMGVVTPDVPAPTPGPITGLACERQYYNPANFIPEYNLSVEGVDLTTTRAIECTFSVSAGGSVVATDSAKGELTAAPERNGTSFRCTTKRLKLEPGVSTVVDVMLKNDANQTASCTQTFILPQP